MDQNLGIHIFFSQTRTKVHTAPAGIRPRLSQVAGSMQLVELHRTSYWRRSDDAETNLQMYLKEQILHVAVMRVRSRMETVGKQQPDVRSTRSTVAAMPSSEELAFKSRLPRISSARILMAVMIT